MNQHPTPKRFPTESIKKVGLILAGLFLAYTIIGFWIVPPIAKPRMEKALSRAIGREVTIGSFHLNPLTLSATTANLAISETDGTLFAGFEELYVNAELSSIFRWALSFKEIRLSAPHIILKVLPGGKLNIGDILAGFNQAGPEPETEAELPRTVVSLFQVEDGTVTIADHMGSEPVVDTLSPVTFTLENLSTLQGRNGVYSFTGEGIAGGRYLLDGKVSLNPVRIEGRFGTKDTQLPILWSHLQGRPSFRLATGAAETSGYFTVEVVGDKLQARLRQGNVALTDVALTKKDDDAALASLPNVSVEGIEVDLTGREVVVGRVSAHGARFAAWLAPDGSFIPGSLLLKDLENLRPAASSAESGQKTDAGPPWHVAVRTIDVRNWHVDLEDRTLPAPARFTLDDITMAATDLSTRTGEMADVAVDLRINGAGTLRVEGKAGIDPAAADLSVSADRLEFAPFQPYVDTAARVRVKAGAAGANGRIVFQGKKTNREPLLRYRGNIRVDGVKVNDLVNPDDFIGLSRLQVRDIELDLVPNRLQAAEVSIRRPSVRVTIDRDGSVNVVQVFSPAGEEKKSRQPNLLQRLVSFLILQFKGPMPMDVGLVQLDDFIGDFVDASASPEYATRLRLTNATVKGLSSDPSTMADFRLSGGIEPAAVFESTGRLNPMNAEQFAEIDFEMNDFRLPPVSPYSGRFVGYGIEKGDLHLRLKYRVDDNRVTGDNRIVIDHLLFGARVDSPDALNLPVTLAVAILKDDDDRIALRVPVKGNVKDPHFDFLQTITSALTGQIDEVGQSPFAAIGEIDGFGGEELRYVSFGFGSSALDDREVRKLEVMADILNDRTALRLALQGSADRQMDGVALSGGAPPEKETTAAARTDESTGQGRPDGGPGPDDDRIRQLARMRAQQVRDHLIREGGVSAERVVLRPARLKDAPDGDRGRVELFLSAP